MNVYKSWQKLTKDDIHYLRLLQKLRMWILDAVHCGCNTLLKPQWGVPIRRPGIFPVLKKPLIGLCPGSSRCGILFKCNTRKMEKLANVWLRHKGTAGIVEGKLFRVGHLAGLYFRAFHGWTRCPNIVPKKSGCIQGTEVYPVLLDICPSRKLVYLGLQFFFPSAFGTNGKLHLGIGSCLGQETFQHDDMWEFSLFDQMFS